MIYQKEILSIYIEIRHLKVLSIILCTKLYFLAPYCLYDVKWYTIRLYTSPLNVLS